MKRKNIEFLIGFLDAVRRQDRDAVRAALKPDIVWHGLRPELVCRSFDEVVDIYVANGGQGRREVDLLELIGGEEHAILHAVGAGLGEAAGVTLADGIYNVFAIGDGIAVGIADYARREDALAAAGLRTPT